MKQYLERICQLFKQVGRFLPILGGLTTYWYDHQSGDFRRNTISRLLPWTLNIIGLIWIMYWDLIYIEIFFNKQLNPVMRYVVTSRYFVIALPPISALVQILFRESRFIQIQRNIRIQEMECLKKIAPCPEIEIKFKLLRFFKYLIVAFIFIINGYWAWDMSKEYYLLAFLYVNVISLPNFLMLQYYLVLAKLCRLCFYIDKHIRQVAQEVTNLPAGNHPTMECRTCCEIYWLRLQHSKLARLYAELQALFKCLLYLKRFMSLFNVGMRLYFTLVSWG
uniref:Gustatory receptor n=1 Tax=Stomoxys calcitrans TaxID=35570 RepID=A0A905STE8_STOCA